MRIYYYKSSNTIVKKFDLDTNYFPKNEDLEKVEKKEKIKN